MTAHKPFGALPDVQIVTSWLVVVLVISTAFGAGVWATSMSNRVQYISEQISEMRADLRDVKNTKAVAKHP